MLSTGEVVYLETLIDADGDDTDDPSMAYAGVGEMASGDWICVDFSAFEMVTYH